MTQVHCKWRWRLQHITMAFTDTCTWINKQKNIIQQNIILAYLMTHHQLHTFQFIFTASLLTSCSFTRVAPFSFHSRNCLFFSCFVALPSVILWELVLQFPFFCLCVELPFSHGCTAMLRLPPLVAATVTHQYPTFLPFLSKTPPILDNVWIWPYFAWQSNDSLLFFLFHIYFLYFLRAEKQNGVKIKIKWKLKLKKIK